MKLPTFRYLSCVISITLLLSTSLTSQIVNATEEYFGQFDSEPSFTVKTNNSSRPTFVLNTDLKFIDPNSFNWVAPAKTEVDGASIPSFAWSFVGGPMSGKYLHASIIHDYFCITKERTAHDTHRNFYYGMRAKGVDESKAKLMYLMVRTFGPSWKITYTTHSLKGFEKTITGYTPTAEISELPLKQKEEARQYINNLSETLERSNGKTAPTVCQSCATYQLPATLDNLDRISEELSKKLK